MNIDTLALDQSLATDVDNIEFVSKKWVYCNDQNSGSYSGGTVLIDSTSLTNSGAFNNVSEGFLLIPLAIQLTSGTAANLPINNFVADNLWALKDGFQMINSISIEYNGTNVVQETPYINIYNSFKAKTTWSWSDVMNDGPSSIFFPDNAASWQYAAVSANTSNLSSGGVGLQNNRDTPSYVAYTGVGAAALGEITTATPSYGASPVAGIPVAGVYPGIPSQNSFIGNPTSYNDGFAIRKSYTNYDPSDSTTLNQGAVNSAVSCATIYRNFKQTQSTEGSVVWNAYLKLRLKDLGDFFQQMPLSKGATFRIRLTTNQCITNFTTTRGTFGAAGAPATFPTLTVNSTTITAGLTCPLQIASAGLGQGASCLPADTYNLSVSIYRNTNTVQTSNLQTGSTDLQSIRLYLPCYTFNPIVESNYLTMNAQRKILYNDVFQYQITNQSGQFNFLVSNGIPNIQQIIVVPLISQASSNGTNGTIGTLLSPCCNSGASPDPLQITNFQVQISGQNLFMENEYYDFQQFMEELRSINQLNGSLTTGLTSGLINEFQFSRGMRYYVANASRILPSEKGITRSVNIQGLNVSSLAMDIYVFVVFQKSITINCATGQIISM